MKIAGVLCPRHERHGSPVLQSSKSCKAKFQQPPASSGDGKTLASSLNLNRTVQVRTELSCRTVCSQRTHNSTTPRTKDPALLGSAMPPKPVSACSQTLRCLHGSNARMHALKLTVVGTTPSSWTSGAHRPPFRFRFLFVHGQAGVCPQGHDRVRGYAGNSRSISSGRNGGSWRQSHEGPRSSIMEAKVLTASSHSLALSLPGPQTNTRTVGLEA